ncbi:MAG: hypothetical protein GF331_19385 [Chitinivibrionales bacterium]|nr:hypothetical protein [Chitinivibrionales bacterium]
MMRPATMGLAVTITVLHTQPFAAQPQRISVYGLKPIGVSRELAVSIQEHLESNLLTYGRYEVLSRSDIDLILQESRFQQSGACNDESCLVEAGTVLGVEKLVTGTISRVGSTYNLVLKLIDIRSATLESSANQRHAGSVDNLLDVGEQLLDTLLRHRAEPLIDTIVKTVVRTRTDTVTVRDTVWAMPAPQPLPLDTPPALPDTVPATPTTAMPAPEQTRTRGWLGVGAAVILGTIAATVLTVSIGD